MNIAYLDVVNQIARAAMSGNALPSIRGKLLSRLFITGICFAGEEVVSIDEGSGKCVIKPREAPAGGPSLIDTTADLVMVGDEERYVFGWPLADSVELRAYLDAQADPTQPVEMRCEIEYTIAGDAGRIAFPILMETGYNRPEDPAPSAISDTSWVWLQERLAAGDNVDLGIDDSQKKITIDVEVEGLAQLEADIATNASAIASEATTRAAADTAMQSDIATNASAITSEATTRAAADTAMQGDIATNASAISSEATTRAAADIAMQSDIATNASAISSEATTRAAADTAMQSDIATNADAIAALKLDELQAPSDITTLNATTSAHGLLPKLGGGTTNFLRADGAWAAPAGGGGGVNGMEDFAFVNSTSGNDSTAALGDPSKPWLTLNAACTASLAFIGSQVAKIFIQAPCTDDLDVTDLDGVEIHLYGASKEISYIPAIALTRCPNVKIIGNGRNKIYIGNITSAGAAGATGANGDPGGNGGATGDTGGNGGNVTLYDLSVTDVYCVGGQGGQGGNGSDGAEEFPSGAGGTGGTGGTGGNIIISDCAVVNGTLSVEGGVGGNWGYRGADGGGGIGGDGSGGNGGDGGTITMDRTAPPFSVGCYVYGAGGAGGSGSGDGTGGGAGADGTMLMQWSEITTKSGLSGAAKCSYVAELGFVSDSGI